MGEGISCQSADFEARQKAYSRVMKILIADPHPQVQSALRLILERIPEVSVVSESGSLVQILAQCAHQQPDLILFDLELARPSRVQPRPLPHLLSELKRLCPGSKVGVMSIRFDVQQEALEAGASGFISKTDAPDEVLTSIIRLLENGS